MPTEFKFVLGPNYYYSARNKKKQLSDDYTNYLIE